MQKAFVKTIHGSSQHREERHTVRSSMSLSQLKKTTQNFPLLQNTLPASERNAILRKNLSSGKLRVGSTNKPTVMLNKEQRKNPFHKDGNLINEEIINKKGLFELTTMGAINKQIDCF